MLFRGRQGGRFALRRIPHDPVKPLGSKSPVSRLGWPNSLGLFGTKGIDPDPMTHRGFTAYRHAEHQTKAMRSARAPAKLCR